MIVLQWIYYSFAFLAILWEVFVFWNPKKVTNFISENEHKDRDEIPFEFRALAVLMFCYAFWVIMGLFTNQWFLFLALLALSLIPKKYYVLRCIDAFLSVSLLIFIIINQFHLHYTAPDVLAFIKSFF